MIASRSNSARLDLVRALAARDANESQQFKTKGLEKFRLEDENSMLTDLLYATEEFVANEKATTLAGAMAQALVAMSDARTITDHVDEKHDHCEKYMRRIERALYSAIAVMAEASGVNPAEVGSEFYAGVENDPHIRLSKAGCVMGVIIKLGA